MGPGRHHPGAGHPAVPGAAAGVLVVCAGGGAHRVWRLVYSMLLVKGEGDENIRVSHAALSGAYPAALSGIEKSPAEYIFSGREATGAVPAGLHLPLMEIEGSTIRAAEGAMHGNQL